MKDQQTFIGLGSNLDDPEKQIDQALEAIQSKIAEGPIKTADKVCTPPLGGPEQDYYLNTVCCFSSNRSAHEILTLMREIENSQGRRRDIHWGPRTIDLDLLLHGDEIIEDSDLSLPHPGIHKREFVLVPLLQLAPELKDPNNGQPYQDSLDKLTLNQSSTIVDYASYRKHL